jgi:N-ethylmaleimide reductase
MMDLFSSFRLGPLSLPNRIVMAPMTRARCADGRAPTPLVAEYYRQRAGAGLIICEATSVSPLSVSRLDAAALFEDRQIAGWKLVANAVHAAGGRVFHQLYHLGRKSDPTAMPNGQPPVAPSAIAATGKVRSMVRGKEGMVDFAVPRALETHEVGGIVDEFRAAAARSKAAGMDGVELHGANAYLIAQFLCDGTNTRTDRYGGSIENRARFLLEIVDAVAGVMGPDRVGVRLSPHASGDGISESDPVALYGYVARALSRRGIAYVHLVESEGPGYARSPAPGTPALMPIVRELFTGPLMVNGNYTRALGDKVIREGRADLVSFAALFIPNPDLVERLRRNGPFNTHDEPTTYGGGAKGFTDYPTLV